MQRPESLLIVAAKQPGHRAQKHHEGVVYKLQAAQQLCYSLMINTVHDGIQQCHGAPLPQPSLKAASTPTDLHIYENTDGTTHGILTSSIGDDNVPHFDIKWNTKTNVSKLQLNNSLLCYLYTQFGHTVNFCTENKWDIYTFQCHPSYGSAGPIFDWMIIKFNTGLFPCRLADVLLDHFAPDGAVQLVVQSTTSRTPVKSTLFQEWNWSAEYITVSPNTIEAPCFVISIRYDNSRVLETLAREIWADQFTNTE